MTIIDAAGLQQVLSLSNIAEKVQQTNQHRPDQAQQNFSEAIKQEDQNKKTEIPPSNNSEESMLREEYTDKGGIKYKNRSRKRKKRESDSDETSGEFAHPDDGGKIVDIVV